ncbi:MULTISPECIES: AAA family ATPase [Alteromonadales]|jgi:MoxR-like ATPase|uniref:AAA family ATPase n=4 Tax=Alteromonadales TaxID=135622 RepID=A0AAC8XN47_9ALTE|nr:MULTISPECIES: MoxR family ATPase [Alteromonadaceae]MCG8498471.1 MoxR family ATPase [Enterobacterales bacterium]MCP4985455.1 MoxR family ATPase [Colwellia sp.]AFV87517.1 hypothetical protein amad1_20220 [Alteromonas mediterranea DE1]AGP83770.1 hypothetical protein I533_19105 [Alteromonas mediterranea MED64]AGP99533.1 hypothetical protein I635_20210 [Alteromonas mediterranea UM7]|tara:strand:- start:10424 stop:11395 length:972 start_codon:yes stop_codon:yes gene_type:complete
MAENILAQIKALQSEVNQSILGQEKLVNALIIALLTNGNVLLEGLPGTAKTRSIRTLAKVLEAKLGRIQFTPDLLPSDVTGTEMFQDIDGKTDLSFKEGPIFNQLVLADEINRAPAKVQAALLEAMEERQVTVMGKSYQLPDLFMVLATQNPIEQEGTYPLPEAQIDRFALKIQIDYPDDEQELSIIRLVRSEEGNKQQAPIKIQQSVVFDARQQVLNIHMSEAVEKYIVAIVMATRKPERYPNSNLKNWIAVGASPRASIILDRCSRAQAFLNEKDYVDPDDVRQVVCDVLRHRINLSYEAQADGITSDDVINEIIKQVAVV